VQTAKEEPLRYGKNGELLIDYEATEEHAVRTYSNTTATREKPTSNGVENINHNQNGGQESGDSSSYEKRETETV